MKFHKLVKSIDYVTYPVLIELRKIYAALGDSMSNLRSIILSAVIGVIIDLAPVSETIIEGVVQKSSCLFLLRFAKYEHADTIMAIVLSALIYGVLHFIHVCKTRFRSNKNSVGDRKAIVYEFYRVILPNLISVKSILKQHDESTGETAKQHLLLLQAKYELEELITTLSNMQVLEVNENTGILRKHSKNVLEQIGADTYFTILLDIINNVQAVFTGINAGENTDTAISLRTCYFAAPCFIQCANVNIAGTLCETVKHKYQATKQVMADAIK